MTWCTMSASALKQPKSAPARLNPVLTSETRADEEKSRADAAESRADKYEKILKEHGLL